MSNSIYYENMANHLDNRRLHLIIMTTEKCNFRCLYCYEDFKKGKIKVSVLNGIENLIRYRLNDLDVLEIGWFGGEPLLNIKAINRLGSFSKNIVGNNRKFLSSISTNGYLLDLKNTQILYESGVQSIQISLDGDQLAHDRTRVLASQEGTFCRIWENLIRIKESSIDINVNIRLHINKYNVLNIEKIISQINKVFSNDYRFKVYVKKIENLGNNRMLDNIMEKDFSVDYIESMLEKSLICNNNQKNPDICYAAAANSLVIRSDGNISKCTVILNDSDNLIGRINEDGTLDIQEHIYSKWVSSLFDPNLAKCPISHVKSII